MNTILENRLEGLLREKLCKKGQAYRKRRMAAKELAMNAPENSGDFDGDALTERILKKLRG